MKKRNLNSGYIVVEIIVLIAIVALISHFTIKAYNNFIAKHSTYDIQTETCEIRRISNIQTLDDLEDFVFVFGTQNEVCVFTKIEWEELNYED